MNNTWKIYLNLFWATLKISAFTFGGGYVIVPLMRKKFVEELKWIDEKEMLDLIAIAQSVPGAIAVNTSILIGYRKAGIKGSLATVLGTVLPPLIILSIVYIFYSQIKDNNHVKLLLHGMSAGIAAAITDAVFSMCKGIVKEKKLFSLVIMIASFIAVLVFDINPIALILLCGIAGLIKTLYITYQRRAK